MRKNNIVAGNRWNRLQLVHKSLTGTSSARGCHRLLQETGAHQTLPGQPPSPCSNFTLTPLGETRAAKFGGSSGPVAVSDDTVQN